MKYRLHFNESDARRGSHRKNFPSAAVRPAMGPKTKSDFHRNQTHMSKKTKKSPAPADTLDGDGKSGTTGRGSSNGLTNNCHSLPDLASALAVFIAMLLITAAVPATAQSLDWDKSRSNPFVAIGLPGECTAYAWGRFKVLNNHSLAFTQSWGRHGGAFYDLAVEGPTIYRDQTPVRGATVSWKKDGDFGHVAIIERVNSDASCDISEQNWPTGAGPSSRKLSATDMTLRYSNGKPVFKLAGYVNPNRPSAFGTVNTSKTSNLVRAQFALMDEDRRQVNLLSALVWNGQVVNGTTISGNVPSNAVITANFNAAQLQRGRTYTIYIWATDFRGLKATKTATIVW
jgi:hypothetical protein